jgi:hypothetical protein
MNIIPINFGLGGFMSKWLIWTLLELTTFLLLANVTFLVLSHLLKKKRQENPIKEQEASSEDMTSDNTEVPENPNAFKHLARHLDLQINHAADSIRLYHEDQHETNTLKLWGTILKAERAIVLNQASATPKPILNRFLANLLYALSAPKLQTTDTNELNKNLKDVEEEFLQASELLITKESLTKNQLLLNEDLRKNIDRATKRVNQLGIKQVEQVRLQAEIDELQKKIKKIEATQKESATDYGEVQLHAPEIKKIQNSMSNTSFKQLSTLSSLSNRQKMVIDQLKNEIEKTLKSNNSQGALEAQKVAIAKMERMSEESESLILQLDNELKSSNLSITSLKQDINAKDIKIAEMEAQLSSNNETAIGNLQTLHVNKKETLNSLRTGLDTALENMPTDGLIEQDKDTKMLERLLLESETCVTLLAQELDSAEDTNNELKAKVEALSSDSKTTSDESKLLLEQREKNRTLVQQTTDLKNKLFEIATSKNHQELRVTYNKKSLECDRLQLAFSDLEIKYLKTLN